MPEAQKHAEGFAVVDREVVRHQLGDAVGAARMKQGRLVLRRGCVAEHFRGRGLIETDLRIGGTHGFEQADRAECVHLDGEDRLIERGADEALRREIVDLVRLGALDHPGDVGKLQELAVITLDVARDAEPGKAREGRRCVAPRRADHAIAFAEQQLCEVRAVLSGGAGDQRGLAHGAQPVLSSDAARDAALPNGLSDMRCTPLPRS